MEALIFFVFPVLLSLWVAFWVIRLGVRYGVDDALRKNRPWLRPEQRAERNTHSP